VILSISQFRFFLILSFLFTPSLFFQCQAQVSGRMFKQPSKEMPFEQFLMIDGHTAIALTNERKGRKLTNTILLIRDEKIVDSYVHNSSLDYLYILDDISFIAFQPLGSQLLFNLDAERLVIVDKTKIPFFKSLWSSSSMEGILGFHNGLSIYFDQSSNGKALARYDSTNYPLFFVYNGVESVQVNEKLQKSSYQHWPRYAEVASPPMSYVKLIDDDIYFSMSNLGLTYVFNTNSNKVESTEFPKNKGVRSWSMFYDHLDQQYYWVAYMGSDRFEIYKKDEYNKEAMVIHGFFDSITGGKALQKIEDDSGVRYSLIKIEN